MKALARSYAWWPGIDKQIEVWVKRCQLCQASWLAPPKATSTPFMGGFPVGWQSVSFCTGKVEGINMRVSC